ncbi:DUF1800 domain-containing protein [Motilibacter rhizosphaerae]|uniref:DUF1800 domain-containing protein n=1 Tax=Motilibacter rhizosphaerae TaxID=598652 RepID=UPI001E5D9CFF|nr:DUF1800 domain-containing protein [Motilibacter rhizosphaerae]
MPLDTVHLLRRTTYGITPELLADVAAVGGPGAWLEQQLAPQGVADPVADAVLARFPLAVADPPVCYGAMSNGAWDSMVQVVGATVARQLWSRRQLLEVMVDFWSNHLNITCPSSEVWATKAWDDVHVVRANALGSFADMLAASVTSPAMLLYLNNAESQGRAPNENYGRELLELHTVGIDAGYAQADVVAAARALSGLSVWNPWNGGTAATNGTFRYRADWHWVGPVQVLGWQHPNADRTAGVAVARSLVRYLAGHPATAARIARKLAVRFVSDDPPQSLVDALAAAYLAGGTAVVPVLRALFASPEFAASVGQKVRRPHEDWMATLRAVGVAPDPTSSSRAAVEGWMWAVEDLGNGPLGWGQPDGYPDVASAWSGAGTTLGRWNLHLAAVQQWWKDGVTYAGLADRLLGATKPTTRGALVDALCARLLPGQTLTSAHRAALVGFLGADGPVRNGDLTWMLGPLVAVVLDSPYWSVR